MLICSWCKHKFFDGEVVTIQLVKGTEFQFHFECLDKSLEPERLLRAIFGETEPLMIETFTRTVWRAQESAGGAVLVSCAWVRVFRASNPIIPDLSLPFL